MELTSKGKPEIKWLGYHRACACYHYDEDSDVCAKLVNC